MEVHILISDVLYDIIHIPMQRMSMERACSGVLLKEVPLAAFRRCPLSIGGLTVCPLNPVYIGLPY